MPRHRSRGEEAPPHGPISNLFTTHSGVVLALGFGAPRVAVTVELSSEYVNPTRTAIVHHAGATSSTVAPKNVSDGFGVEYAVALGDDGEAMLQIPY